MRLRSIYKMRCPHCLKGEVFSSMFKMHEHCPNCGIDYEREHGFFMMSIFFGYIIGFVFMVPVLLVLFLMKVPIFVYFIVSTIVLIPLAPFIFRYSRVLWLHIDEILDPRPVTPKE